MFLEVARRASLLYAELPKWVCLLLLKPFNQGKKGTLKILWCSAFQAAGTFGQEDSSMDLQVEAEDVCAFCNFEGSQTARVEWSRDRISGPSPRQTASGLDVPRFGCCEGASRTAADEAADGIGKRTACGSPGATGNDAGACFHSADNRAIQFEHEVRGVYFEHEVCGVFGEHVLWPLLSFTGTRKNFIRKASASDRLPPRQGEGPGGENSAEQVSRESGSGAEGGGSHGHWRVTMSLVT